MSACEPTPGEHPRPDSQAGADGPARDLETRVYEDLRALARRQMRGERPGHTLTATALVHEAYLKLDREGLVGNNAARFYQAAAEAMRRILIDHARRRNAAKRGAGGRTFLDIGGAVDLAHEEHLEDALALDEAISRLDQEDHQAASVVRLRFFAGLSGDEAAALLCISPRQADREWAYARAFLLRVLGEPGERREAGRGEPA